jgi:hypothetical protein
MDRQKFLSILLLVSPVLNVYGFVPFGFGTLIYGLISAALFFHNRKMKLLELPWYILYLLAWRSIVAISNGDILHIVSPNLMLFIFGFLSLSIIDINYFIKYYKIIAILICLIFLMQYVGYYLFDLRLIFVSNIIPLNTGLPNNEYISTILLNSNRFSTFFLEPAHQSIYLIPLLVYYSTIRTYNIREYIALFILMLVLVLSNSGVGIISAFSIFISIILRKYSNMKLLFFALFPLIVILIYYSNIVELLGPRSNEIFDPKDTDSGYIRVLRGFWVFDALDNYSKVFGLGIPGNLLEVSSKTYLFLDDDDLYLSGFHYILVYSGIIGAGLFLLHIFHKFKRFMRNFVSIIIILMLVTPFFPSQEMLFIYVIFNKLTHVKEI